MKNLKNAERSALIGVLYERTQQDRKFGKQSHSDFYWICIIMEELGELSDLLHKGLLGLQDVKRDINFFDDVKFELRQVAAVGLVWLEQKEEDRELGDYDSIIKVDVNHQERRFLLEYYTILIKLVGYFGKALIEFESLSLLSDRIDKIAEHLLDLKIKCLSQDLEKVND